MTLFPSRFWFVFLALLLSGVDAFSATPEERRPLPGSIKELPHTRTKSVDKVAPQDLAARMEVQVALKMRNFAKLTERTQAGERIPLAELDATYLPLPADYHAVLDWARAEHLTVELTDPMRLAVFVSGTVGQIQQALQTQFARVTLDDGVYTSAVTTPSLPARVSGPVLGVNGLQPHVRPHHMQAVQPQTNSNPPYLVKEILKAYGAGTISFTGAGEKIAVLIDAFPLDSDLTNFWSHNNVSQTLGNIEKVQVVSGTMPPPTGEESLDVEWTSGIASQSVIRIYGTKDLSFINIDKGIQRIINDLPSQPNMHQLSISLGLGETYVGTSQKVTDAQYFATLASQGVSTFVSSGDSGSQEGGILQVSYFASDPNVTAVGGTSLRLFASGAVSTETVWSGSGGGISAYFSRPVWQTGIGVPAGTKRLVPDVALVADPATGAYVYLNGGVKQFGGTSWSAPVWAGFSAMINQARKQNGRGPLGLLNPQIYPLGGTPNFRDVVSGSNGAYSAASAYDMATGLGVPQMSSLLVSLAGTGTTAPSITSFSPAIGSVGSTILVSGVNLDRATNVKIGPNSAGFVILSSSSVRITVPPGAISGLISITTSSGTATSANTFTVAPPVTNDNFASALVISGPSGQVSGSSVAATKQTGEPSHAGNAGGASVWYDWTAPTTGTFTFATNGSSFDTLLAIYTGSALTALTPIVSSDDAGTSTGSSATFSATSGTTYHIAVDGYNGAKGSVTLIWAANSAAPVISTFTPQTGTPGTPVIMTGANLLGANSVKFGGVTAGFVVDSDTQLTATVPSGAITGAIVVANAAGNASTDGNFVVVASSNNDNFAGAAPLGGASGSVTGTNAGATKEPNEPAHAGNAGGKSVWYTWTATADGTFTFDTNGSSFDTLLGVYTGSSVAGLTQIVANDDAGSISTSSASFNADVGTVYYIAVDGYNGVGGNVVLNWRKNSSGPVINSFIPSKGPVGTPVVITGANFTGASSVKFGGVAAVFTLASDSQIFTTVPPAVVTGPITITTPVGTGMSAGEFKLTAGPSNDAFIDATALSGPSISVAGSNVGATRETGEPDHAGNSGGPSVWWTWTAPSDGSFAISTQGSSFDTLLAVYTGTEVDALTLLSANDDDPAGGNTSAVSINAVAGTTYRIAVDGLNGASGAVALSIYAQGFSTIVYSTGFEAAEGFVLGTSLTGHGGWTSTGSGGNDIITGKAGMTGQHATIGEKPPAAGGNSLVLAHPAEYLPTTTQPLLKFSVTMAIEDSENFEYDDFHWRLYNRAGDRLFTLDFNNYDLSIYYQLQGQSNFTPTFVKFSNGRSYKLEVTMDFSRNLLSATLNGNPVVTQKPIRLGNVPLDFGGVDARWEVFDSATPGDNYMVFDDLSVLAQQSPVPRITFPPLSKQAVSGDAVSFSVVATGLAPLNYQWMKKGVPIAGATTSSLSMPSVTAVDAGSYTVKVVNPVGQITSPPAVLSIKSAPAIVVPPVNIVSAAGRAPAFKVVASGDATLKYQWFREGGMIQGATRAILTLPNVKPEQSGNYTVTITNSVGVATSTPVSLTVGASFAAVKGPYNVVLANGGNGTNERGLFKLALGATGAFSGTASFAGQSWRLAGSFDNSGHWTKALGKDRNGQAVSIDLQVGLAGSESITGLLKIGVTQIAINAQRNPYNSTSNLAPQAGKYTFALPTAAGLPAGSGYATVTVDKLGNVRAAGKLGDYTIFSSGTTVDPTGEWPFYLSLYSGKGYISGAATFRPHMDTDLDGTLHWYKPQVTTGMYLGGFEGDVLLSGSSYKSEAGVRVFPLDSAHQGKVAIGGGDITVAVTETIETDTSNHVKILTGNAPFTLRLTSSTGLITGTVKPAGSARALPYNGVVLQKTNTGTGVIKGSTATSVIDITPATP